MSNIKLFEEKRIRSVWNEADKKMFFVVEDVVRILTDSVNPKDYIKKLKKRDPELSKGWGQIVPTLAVDTPGGKQKMSCANALGFPENEQAAVEGGTVAGNARKELEKKSGRQVVTSQNYKSLSEKKVRQLRKKK